MNLIERIDEARTRWNVLDHPFYLRWERGELSREDLAYYAGEYRHAVVALADAAAVGGRTPSGVDARDFRGAPAAGARRSHAGVGRLDADRTAHRCRSDTGGRTVNGSGRCSGE